MARSVSGLNTFRTSAGHRLGASLGTSTRIVASGVGSVRLARRRASYHTRLLSPRPAPIWVQGESLSNASMAPSPSCNHHALCSVHHALQALTVRTVSSGTGSWSSCV
jgi:hypothetical protein